MNEWILFACCMVIALCYLHAKRQARRQIADLTVQRDEAQERFEQTSNLLRVANEQVDELAEISQRSNNRAEGYSEILVRMFDGFRKASDEYEKVRRGRKQ